MQWNDQNTYIGHWRWYFVIECCSVVVIWIKMFNLQKMYFVVGILSDWFRLIVRMMVDSIVDALFRWTVHNRLTFKKVRIAQKENKKRWYKNSNFMDLLLSLSLSFSLVQYNNISIKPGKTFSHWIPKIWLYFLYLRLAFESIHKKLLMAFSYCVYNRANDVEKPIYNFFAVFPSAAEWKLKQQQKSDFVTF